MPRRLVKIMPFVVAAVLIASAAFHLRGGELRELRLQVEPVATGLRSVWDMEWAPDGEMWITERAGRVSRIDVKTGRIVSLGEIPEVFELPPGENGLMGMAFHPDFPREPWVYFVHSFGSQEAIRNRLIRVRYENGSLGASEILIDNIGGRRTHNGSRLVIGPDRMLYMTMGDATRTSDIEEQELDETTSSPAQNRRSLNGKILRLTLEGRPAPDNPFGNEVWSWGHRNPQGLAFQPATGILFASEHGAATDDEINLIEKGKNYGWPVVRGRCDTPEEQKFCSANDVAESVFEWTPTRGIAGATFYDHDLIPGWKGSLLVTSLRGGTLYRLVLTEDGRRAASIEGLFERQYGRLRDVLVGPDGAVYLATSNHDGRARIGPFDGDDKVLRVTPAEAP